MHSICWKAIENDTLEDCEITKSSKSYTIVSLIGGRAEGKTVDISYRIEVDETWQVLSFSVEGKVGEENFKAAMQNDNGTWSDADGKIYSEFSGFKYIDITLTPFTNTLPVNHLELNDGQVAEIDVVYVDVMKRKIYTDHQKYTKISDLKYKFENEGGAFSAVIEFDKTGFVTYYPNLFNRQ